MADGGYSMQFLKVQAVTDQMAQKTIAIAKLTTDLEDAAEKALATWDGDAKAQYYAERKVWDDAITRMGAAMGLRRDSLEDMFENTRRTERNNQMKWEGAGSPGGGGGY
jgi:uncharacterized protein YukE